jgi:hypothetical protein
MRPIVVLVMLAACAAATYVKAEDITNKMPRVMGGKMENNLPAPTGGSSLPSGSVHVTPNTTLNLGTGASQQAFPRGSGTGVNVQVTH